MKRTEVDERKLIEAYKRGMGIRDIARKYKVGMSHVYYLFGKYRVKLRTGARYPLPKMASRVQKRGSIVIPKAIRAELKPMVMLHWNRLGKKRYELRVD